MVNIYLETLILLGLMESRTRLANRLLKLSVYCQDPELQVMLDELREEFRQTRTNTMSIPIEDLSRCKGVARRIKSYCNEALLSNMAGSKDDRRLPPSLAHR